MARKKAETPETESKNVKPSEAAPQIGEKALNTLLKRARHADADVQSINGSLREAIADAVENKHLHKKAFSAIRAMDRMTPEKLADYWDTLLLYMDMSGLADRAKSAPRLALEPDADEEGEAETNVKPFPKQSSVAAE